MSGMLLMFQASKVSTNMKDFFLSSWILSDLLIKFWNIMIGRCVLSCFVFCPSTTHRILMMDAPRECWCKIMAFSRPLRLHSVLSRISYLYSNKRKSCTPEKNELSFQKFSLPQNEVSHRNVHESTNKYIALFTQNMEFMNSRLFNSFRCNTA